MGKDTLAVCEGECFAIMWGVASNGQCQARDYYEALNVADRAKAPALFKRMADIGKIYLNSEIHLEKGGQR